MATSYVYKRDATRLFIAMRDNGDRYKIYLPKESKRSLTVRREMSFPGAKNNFSSFRWAMSPTGARSPSATSTGSR